MASLIDNAKARLVSQKAALESTRASLKEARANKWSLAIKHLVNVERRQASAVAQTEALIAEVSGVK